MNSASTAEASKHESITSTASKATRVWGIAALLMTAGLLAFGLFISPEDIFQGDNVRLFYLHVPSATISLYIGFTITLIGSAIYLYNGSKFWDILAGAAAEVSLVFLGITLITGMLWGRPTWGSYWEWDPRLTSTAVSFVLYVGYLAIRNLDMNPEARSRRAAVLGIVAFFNTIIIKYSVQWWRSLHQGQTLVPLDMEIEGLMLFSVLFGVLSMTAIFVWLLLHRFRLGWLQYRVEAAQLDVALLERRGEADAASSNTASSNTASSNAGEA